MKANKSYPAHIQSIPSIRKDLQVLAGDWKLPPSDHKQVLVIIEELFSNIVRFAWEDPSGQFVDLELTLEESALLITISDRGRKFNPLDYEQKEPDDPIEVRDGGMGLTLIRAFSESMEYRREKETNILTIRKSIFF